jgi:hypothetical protein
MITDNWTTCPMCKKKSIDLLEKEDKKIRAAYGKVSQNEYRDMLAKSRIPADIAHNLRENWNIGIQEELFVIDYYASCTKCGWKFQFKWTEEVIK